MATRKRYMLTGKQLRTWAKGELKQIGIIASIADPDVRYAYAIKSLNSMAHLKDAIAEYMGGKKNADMQITHDQVVRVMRHLVETYSLNVANIKAFNTHKVLGSLNYLGAKRKQGRRTRKKAYTGGA